MNQVTTVPSTPSPADQLEALRAAIPHLDERSAVFAGSLLDQYLRRAYLSDKQWHWVGELTRRASGKPDAPEGGIQVGDVMGIVTLIEKARNHLKRPAIMALVQCRHCQEFLKRYRHNPDGECDCPRCQGICECREFRLNLAGDRARVPGSINVCTAGGYDDRDWLGRITREGVYQSSRKLDGQAETAVALALNALATDPVQAAKDYGKLTGVCCFCGLKLTDPQSTDRGYGPICAKHWGLPWGGRHDWKGAC
jgi:hypothetical protein